MQNNKSKFRWEVYPIISEEFKNQFPEINPIILQLLANRGLKTQEEIDEFLLPDYSQDIYDPFIFLEMGKAVERIYRAIENKEKILIYGDYDVDGVTSAVLLYKVLKLLGIEPDIYLPDREKEGYSLNKEAIKSFIEKKINLIITCDCGISNPEEVEEANQAGVDVIITDHHCEPEILPKAYAIINPQLKREKYPFKNLAGVGVVFKLVCALLKQANISNKEAFEKWLLDLVALGTINDSMPLLKENRTLCKYGLLVLNKTKNHGLKVLIEKSGLFLGNLDTQNIYYQIGPRINAAGRMDHANKALKLFLTEGEELNNLALKINTLNEKRQRIVENIFTEVKAEIEIEKQPIKKILIVLKERCPVGVLGLVANKLVDTFARPAIVLTKTSQGKIKASGRSIGDFDLFANLSCLSHYFSGFGGHKTAAGFTLKNNEDFKKFKEEMEIKAEQEIKEEDFSLKMKIDAEVRCSDINWDLQEELEKFEPYGQSNPKPIFLLSNINLKNIEIVGKNSQHRRLTIDEGKKIIYFNSDEKVRDFKIGDKIDMVFELGVNRWNGEQRLEMKAIDIRKCKD